MLKRILKGALPLVVVAVISRFFPPDWAATSWAVLLGLQVGLGWRHLRAGNAIAWAGTALLTSFLVSDVSHLTRWMDRHATCLFYAVFATTGFITVVLGRPFTLAQARLTVPPQFWTHPGFIAINRVISIAWSITFLANAAIAYWGRLGPEATPALCYALIIVTMVYSDRYPAYARSRMAARAASPPMVTAA